MEPTPDPAFIAALADCERLAGELRQAINRLPEVVPTDAAAWLATMTAPSVAEHLGAASLLCDGNQAAVHPYVVELSKALEKVSPAELPSFADALARGMARAAITCPCGVCMFCVDKFRHGEEKARERMEHGFRAGMGVSTAPRIVLARG